MTTGTFGYRRGTTDMTIRFSTFRIMFYVARCNMTIHTNFSSIKRWHNITSFRDSLYHERRKELEPDGGT
nr:MAG TPA: hypothetical protein [Caudoviricetes sp.]